MGAPSRVLSPHRVPPRWGLVVLCFVWLVACAPDGHGPGLDTERVMTHIAVLAHPRVGDSDASRAAADYIRAQVAGIEDLRVGTVTLPEITVMGATYRRAHAVATSDPDLVVRFGPPGKALLVMAHYDTVPGSPGAVDNAAAVATLIELARVLGATPPSVPVMLVFTANEEIGLVGAEALVAQRGQEVALAIALDLVGGSGELSLNGASELIGMAEMRWLANAADRAGVVVRAPLPHRVVSRWWPQAERSDHGPFTRHGIRAFHLYDRGQDGDLIDLAYHSPRDIAARVHASSVDELGRLLRALAATPPPAHGGDGFWLPVVANTVVSRWLLLGFECGLAVIAIAGLRRARVRLRALLAIPIVLAAAGLVTLVERVSIGAAWIHAPLLPLIGEMLLIGGAIGLLGTLARRHGHGDHSSDRALHHAIAIVLPLAIGGVLLALGAAELAWIWLLPAAATAIGLGVLQLLPIVLVLAPSQIREAVWNGFWPTAVPLAIWLTALGLPAIAEAASISRRDRVGPLGVLVLPVGCGLAMIAGVTLLFSAHPRCAFSENRQFDLTCEVDPGVG